MRPLKKPIGFLNVPLPSREGDRGRVKLGLNPVKHTFAEVSVCHSALDAESIDSSVISLHA